MKSVKTYSGKTNFYNHNGAIHNLKEDRNGKIKISCNYARIKVTDGSELILDKFECEKICSIEVGPSSTLKIHDGYIVDLHPGSYNAGEIKGHQDVLDCIKGILKINPEEVDINL